MIQIYKDWIVIYLFSGNEISRVEGLEGLQDLRELVLDRNRIKQLSETSLANQWNLQVYNYVYFQLINSLFL